MPSSDRNSRNYVKNATGVWTPVGYGATDAKVPTTLYSSLSGIAASVSPFGDQTVTMPPVPVFLDTFESSIDTTDRWTLAGTVPATSSAGILLVNPGNTASATTTIVTQPIFTYAVEHIVATTITVETTAVTGNHRFYGVGTPPSGTGTAAAPLQDAVGFEIDTSGVLRASMYSGGTRAYTQALTYPTDGLPHVYGIDLRGDFCFFYIDGFELPCAFTTLQPSHASLPLRLASLNSGSVSGTPIWQFTGICVLDMARQAAGIADGTFPWRRTKVDAAGALRVTQRPADLVATAVGTSGSALTLTISAAGAGLYHYISALSIQKYGAAATAANATPLTITTTNLPGSLAWTYDTLTASGATTLREMSFSAPLKSSAANTNTTIVCPTQTNALWRVTAFYFAAP